MEGVAPLLTKRQRADAALLVVSLLWGLTFPLIRSAVQDIDPLRFVATRFLVAAVAMAPLVLRSASARAGLRQAAVPGLLLGVLAWSSYFTQTIGLQTVAAGRAAFITGTSVILVPLMSPLFRAGRPLAPDLVAAVLATVGLYLLTDPRAGGLTRGDLWILLCALTYAAYIHALQKVLRRGVDPTAVAFLQVVGVALCAVALLPAARGDVTWTWAAWRGILICALLATVACFWLQARFQRDTTPERAALLFSMEPVFAALFAYLLLKETLSGIAAVGAAVILAAVLGSELLRRPAPADPPTP